MISFISFLWLWFSFCLPSDPITSWQIDGETVETVADTILGGSKITADGNCSHEIKRCLLLGRKVMTNLKWSEVAQSCPTLCDPMDCGPLGSSIPRILQARILEWVTIPFSRGSSQPKDWTQVSFITGKFFTIWTTKEIILYEWCYPSEHLKIFSYNLVFSTSVAENLAVLFSFLYW